MAVPAGGSDLERVEYANRQLAALNEVSNHFCRIRDETSFSTLSRGS